MKKKPKQREQDLIKMGRLRGGRSTIRFKSKKDYNRQRFKKSINFDQTCYPKNHQPSYISL